MRKSARGGAYASAAHMHRTAHAMRIDIGDEAQLHMPSARATPPRRQL